MRKAFMLFSLGAGLCLGQTYTVWPPSAQQGPDRDIEQQAVPHPAPAPAQVPVPPPAPVVAAPSPGAALNPKAAVTAPALQTPPIETSANNRLSDAEVQQALAEPAGIHHIYQDAGFGRSREWLPKQWREIHLYLPDAVIGLNKLEAKKQYADYQPTKEDRERAVTILAKGGISDIVSGGCDVVTRIVLVSDEAGRVKAEPYRTEPITSTWGNAYGATNNCQDLRAKFWLDDVKKVRAAAPKGEFYVGIMFTSTMQTFKVSLKNQAKLGLN